MAKEILAIPEEYLREVVMVIEAGLTAIENGLGPTVRDEVIQNLTRWCEEEEEYLDRGARHRMKR